MTRRTRAMTLVEVLVASLLLAMAAGSAVAAWGYLTRVPMSKRLLERALLVASSEIDRRKADGYEYIPRGTSTSWYDAYGAWLGPAATTGTYRAEVTATPVVPLVPTGTNRDLMELRVRVRDAGATVVYHDARTLLCWGGL